MQRIVPGKKYDFVPPYRGRFLASLLPLCFPLYLRKFAGIESIEFSGIERLSESLSAGNRIVLASNHSRFADPMLLGFLSTRIGRPFYYLTNRHAFLESKAQSWIIRRLGGFSINREGVDRRALLTASQLLASGERPLVIFPEGEISRNNDILFPFLRGLSFIVKSAACRAPAVVIHPIAIRYRLIDPDERPLHRVLDQIESSYGWRKSDSPLLKRIVRIGKGLLAMKEADYFGKAQSGELCRRVHRLKNYLIEKLEAEWVRTDSSRCLMSRVNLLRSVILREYTRKNSKAKKALKEIELAVRLSTYPGDYLVRDVTLEKLTETIERLQDDALNRTATIGRWTANVEIGEKIPVNAEGRSLNGLADTLFNRIQTMLR